MCVTDSKKGAGMGGPGGPATGGAPGNVQDPINALQTLARQGSITSGFSYYLLY